MFFSLARFVVFLLLVLVLAPPFHVRAAVEVNIEKTLQTDSAPIDVIVSADGRTTFVLTDNGYVLVYDNRGELTESIEIGSHIDGIDLDPGGERLYATSRQNKTVEIIQLSFIKKINTDGSKFKGPADAPITIAVFSEFQ
jgi:DNA-binding beta-propeller fold protein YncE